MGMCSGGAPQHGWCSFGFPLSQRPKWSKSNTYIHRFPFQLFAFSKFPSSPLSTSKEFKLQGVSVSFPQAGQETLSERRDKQMKRLLPGCDFELVLMWLKIKDSVTLLSTNMEPTSSACQQESSLPEWPGNVPWQCGWDGALVLQVLSMCFCALCWMPSKTDRKQPRRFGCIL